MKTDLEIREKFNVSLDKDGIINLTFLVEELEAEAGTRLAELVRRDSLEIFNKNPDKIYDVIVDLSPLGENVSYSSKETRKIYAGLVSHKQIKNIAFAGPNNIFYKTVVSLIYLATGGNKKAKWFPDREQALSWLKDRKKS